MVQLIKQHKVTGEIVKVEAKREWLSVASGTIPEHVLAKIKAATEANTEYNVLGQEGTYEAPAHVMTDKERELKAYYDDKAKTDKAMSY